MRTAAEYGLVAFASASQRTAESLVLQTDAKLVVHMQGPNSCIYRYQSTLTPADISSMPTPTSCELAN